MRIIFMGSPQFAVPSLELLHASTHEILAVVTQPDRPSGRKLQMQPPPVKVAAERLNIPVLQPVSTRSQDFFEETKLLQPELLAVVAYGEILRPNLLDLPVHGAVNLHASLLPKYRGAAPVARAILEGEAVTGATTILMNEIMDGGPILLQQECRIGPLETAEALATKISWIGATLLRQTIDLLEANELVPHSQDLTQVSYAPKLRKEDGRVDWNHSANRLSRQVRAFNPWPGTFSFLRGMMVKFWLANPKESTTLQPPGTVVDVGKESMSIACGGETVLEILELQPENRPRFSVADFVHGHSIRAGDRFETLNESDNIQLN